MVSASIVLYKNSAEMVRKVLDSVLSSSVDKVWVIDHSPRGNLEKELPDSSKIVYRRFKNKGYGSGNNIAIREAIKEGFKYHVVLNPDVYWTGDIIKKICEYMDRDESVGMTMPRLLYPDGTFQFQSRLLPTPVSLLAKRLSTVGIGEKTVSKYELRTLADWTRIQNLPCLSGSFMFLRLKAVEDVGMFDERFFLYHEDVDLTRRLHEKYKTIYYPEVTAFHRLNRKSARNLRLFAIHVANMWRYFNKWGWWNDKHRKAINESTIKRLNS